MELDPLTEAQKRIENKHFVLKYVRNDFLDFVFIPVHMNHSDVVKKKPLSAGFVDFTKKEVFGYSVGLNLKPRKDDSDIIFSLIIKGE